MYRLITLGNVLLDRSFEFSKFHLFHMQIIYNLKFRVTRIFCTKDICKTFEKPHVFLDKRIFSQVTLHIK